MPIQPFTASLVPDRAGGAPRGVATISPLDDAGAIAALREWRAHLDAGRLTSASPAPPGRAAQEARNRETERILGIRRGTIW